LDLCKETFDPFCLSDDQKEGLSYAISTLDDLHQKVLHDRYVNGLPLAAIAESLQITKGAAVNHLTFCLRKLRHPDIRDYYLQGYHAHLASLHENKRFEAEKKEAFLQSLPENLRSMDVAVLQLPQRVCRLLKRHKIHTIFELAETFRGDYWIRSNVLNAAYKEEIVKKLEMLGVLDGTYPSYVAMTGSRRYGKFYHLTLQEKQKVLTAVFAAG
jgi:hypothetical protein